MKKIITILSLLGSSVAFSQIPNNGMETWGTGGFLEPEGPVNYVSANVFASPLVSTLNPVSVTKGTGADAYSGTFSAKITTVKLASNPATGTIPDTVGVLMLGTVSLASSPPLKSGTPWVQRLNAVEFYYKYSSVNNDNGAMMAYLTKWNGVTRDTLATAGYPITASTSSFTLASSPFNYDTNFPNNTMPDSLHVYFLSSARPWLNSILVPNAPKVGSALWVDEAVAIGLNEKIDLFSMVKVFPNPSSDLVLFRSLNDHAKKVEIIDINGKLIATGLFLNKEYSLTTEKIINGSYVYLIKDKNNSLLSKGKLEIVK
jgi:hypothetical protein